MGVYVAMVMHWAFQGDVYVAPALFYVCWDIL